MSLSPSRFRARCCLTVRKADAEGMHSRRRGRTKNRRSDKKNVKENTIAGPVGCNLFVFHLPDDWLDDDLNEHFSPHGPIISATIMKETWLFEEYTLYFFAFAASPDVGRTAGWTGRLQTLRASRHSKQ